MESCPMCEEHFSSIDDVIEIDGKFYHEGCIEAIPVTFSAFRINDDDGFLGMFEESDKKMAFEAMDEGQYQEVKTFEVIYINYRSETDSRRVVAVNAEKAGSKVLLGLAQSIISVEEVAE